MKEGSDMENEDVGGSSLERKGRTSISLEILRERGPMTLRDLTQATAGKMGCTQSFSSVYGVMQHHIFKGDAHCEPDGKDYRNSIWYATKKDHIQRWCGVCFAWKEEVEGRCASCGNKYMTGRGLPLEDVVVTNENSGYGQLVANMRADADNQEAQEGSPANIRALRIITEYIAAGRWGENPRR